MYDIFFRKLKKVHKMLTQQKSFMKVRNAWKFHTWTNIELDLWQLWCNQNPISNRKGQLKYLFPYTAFLKVNIPRVNLSLPVLYEPPVT